MALATIYIFTNAMCFVFQVASDGLKPKDIVLGAQIDLR